MSPYPVQTDRETIIKTARKLMERGGLDNLSLGSVANKLGIKAPSLYRHIESKGALLHAVIEDTYQDLFKAYEDAIANASDNPVEQLISLAHAQHEFAHANPNAYMLAYEVKDPEVRADPNLLLQRAVILQKIMARISGEEKSLTALRGLLAIGHGFIILELNGQFQRGGDLSIAFEESIRAYLRGWQT